MISYVHSSLLILPMFTHVYLCSLEFTYVNSFLSLAIFTRARSPMITHDFSCLPMITFVYLRKHLCLPMFSRVYLCLHWFIRV